MWDDRQPAPSGAVAPGPTDDVAGTSRSAPLVDARFDRVTSELLAVVEADGRLSSVSPAWTRILGWDVDQLLWRPIELLVHPEDRMAIRAALSAGREGQVTQLRSRLQHVDGDHRWMSWSVTASGGQRLCVLRDLTDELQDVELRDALEEISQVGTWVFDLESGRVQWSAVTRALHGIEPAADGTLLEDNLRFFPPEARRVLEPSIQRLLETGEPYDVVVPFRPADGRELWVRATGRTRRNGRVTQRLGTLQDVTEAQMEREGLRHFRDLVELSEEGIIELDATGTIRFVNQRLAKMLGTTPGSLLGLHVRAIIHPDQQREVQAAFQSLQDGHFDTLRTERHLRFADGPEIWGQIAARATRDTVGALQSVVGIVTDVTDRKRQHDALEETRTLLEQSQRLAELGHFRLDLATDERTWSPAAYEIVGVDPGTFVPTRAALLERIHPEDRDAWFAAYGEARVSGNSEVHYRIRRPDGEERMLRSVVRAEYDAVGQPTHLLGTMQDVTDAHRAQQALRESEERLSRVLAAANDGWWDSDLISGHAFHSDRWWQIHGYERDELPNTVDTWRGLTDPADLERIDLEFRAVIERGLPTVTFRGQVKHKQGHLVPVVVRALIDYAEDGRPIRISGVTTDVTETRRAEMLKDRLVSTVSHELRTPLTSIGGALALVQDGAAGAVPDRVAELIEIARRNTVRLRLLVDDLLDMERLLSDAQPFNLTVQDLEPLIEAAVTDLGPYAASLGVRYEVTERFTDVTVAVDSARLQQVLANYLSNAAKFAPEGSTVEVRTRPVARGVRVEVIDRGPGVPEELGDTVFDKFVQAYPEDLRGPTGTGLGLAISREIVQRLGGQVGFESRPGRTCFWFDLPSAPPVQD